MPKNNVYVVDSIAGSRKRRGVQQYLVKWEGYPDSENTWEDEQNIFCKDLIKKFQDSQAPSTQQPARRGRPAAQTPRKPRPAKNRAVPNDWDGSVDRVLSVEKGEACSTLLVWLLFKDGRRDCFPAAQVRMRCPLHLLEYYEDNLVFCEDGGNPK